MAFGIQVFINNSGLLFLTSFYQKVCPQAFWNPLHEHQDSFQQRNCCQSPQFLFSSLVVTSWLLIPDLPRLSTHGVPVADVDETFVDLPQEELHNIGACQTHNPSE